MRTQLITSQMFHITTHLHFSAFLLHFLLFFTHSHTAFLLLSVFVQFICVLPAREHFGHSSSQICNKYFKSALQLQNCVHYSSNSLLHLFLFYFLNHSNLFVDCLCICTHVFSCCVCSLHNTYAHTTHAHRLFRKFAFNRA